MRTKQPWRIGGEGVACAVLLGNAICGLAQQPTNAVAALRARLMAATGTCVVKVAGIHAAPGLLRPMDTRIVNGQVQARRFADGLRGPNDTLLPVRAIARVIRVEAEEDPKNDVLRITLVAGNAQAPLAFLLSKGSLAECLRNNSNR